MTLKKLFTKDGLKIVFSFMVISMIITLGFTMFLFKFLDYVNILEGITTSGFFWYSIAAASIYSLLLLILFWILSYFDK